MYFSEWLWEADRLFEAAGASYQTSNLDRNKLSVLYRQNVTAEDIVAIHVDSLGLNPRFRDRQGLVFNHLPVRTVINLQMFRIGYFILGLGSAICVLGSGELIQRDVWQQQMVYVTVFLLLIASLLPKLMPLAFDHRRWKDLSKGAGNYRQISYQLPMTVAFRWVAIIWGCLWAAPLIFLAWLLLLLGSPCNCSPCCSSLVYPFMASVIELTFFITVMVLAAQLFYAWSVVLHFWYKPANSAGRSPA